MCIIIAREHHGGSVIDDATLARAWDANPHGAGIAFHVPGEKAFRVARFFGAKGSRRLRRAVAEIDRAHGRPAMIVHCRIATSGDTDISQTHPHITSGGDLAVFHNGIITGLPGRGAQSDTARITADILSRMGTGWIDDGATVDTMEGLIGYSNKLVIMRGDGKVCVIGRSRGTEQDGLWYSGHSAFAGTCRYGTGFQGSSPVAEYYDWDSLSGPTITPCRVDAPSTRARYATEGRARKAGRKLIWPEMDTRHCPECARNLLGQVEQDWGLCSICAKAQGLDFSELID